ncbi:MAG TPA: hypothetical protein DIU15_14465 [Deltaproteobacteria bacterium]|nr:hypothetical protein [Deltaproteobacteria bacterium]HCP47242.1 hypothetical protein [Deltaproteobacteria bacterium]
MLLPMQPHKAFALTVALLLGVLLIGCAAHDGVLREPRLTNPPRTEAWLGQVAGPQNENQAEPATAAERMYAGAVRLPLSDDWTWELPDEGRWAISRLELGVPQFDGDRVLVGSSRSAGLFVLERTTGRLLRTIETEGPVQAAPTRIASGWLLVDSFGNLQRLDDDLEPVWPKPYATQGAVFSSAALDGDQVLVATSDDTVVAVGLEDGLWRWSHRRDVTRGALELAILGAPTPQVRGDEVLAGFSDGALVGLDRATGLEKWSVQVGDGQFPDIQSEPVVFDDLIVVGAFGGPLLGIDANSQAIRWRNEDLGASTTMTLVDEALYVSDAKGSLHSINPRTGVADWTWEVKNSQLGSPMRVAGMLLVGDLGGTLHAIDRYEGTSLWTYRPSDGIRIAGIAAAPRSAGRQVLVLTAGGTVRSLLAPAGTPTDLSEEPAHRNDRALSW